jgi:hypothetical protein
MAGAVEAALSAIGIALDSDQGRQAIDAAASAFEDDDNDEAA